MATIKTAADQALFDVADFQMPAGVTHVCAGGETPPLRRHAAGFAAYLADKAQGPRGRVAQEAKVEAVREVIGRHWQRPAHDIGFVGNVAEGISMLVESLAWREGDNICVDIDEYPSIVAPFAVRRGVAPAIRFAEGGSGPPLGNLVDRNTRLIAVSYVSYLNGARAELLALRRQADAVGALLVVDFTQAAGYLPIDAGIADFAFSACYKWLLGITGTAIACWNRERQPYWQPSTAGWYSLASAQRPNYAMGLELRPDAMRFTRGNPAHASIYVLAEALDYLSRHDVRAVESHVQTLTTDLHQRLRGMGLVPTTPAEPLRHGASVCFDSPRAKEIVEGLEQRGIFTPGTAVVACGSVSTAITPRPTSTASWRHWRLWCEPTHAFGLKRQRPRTVPRPRFESRLQVALRRSAGSPKAPIAHRCR